MQSGVSSFAEAQGRLNFKKEVLWISLVFHLDVESEGIVLGGGGVGGVVGKAHRGFVVVFANESIRVLLNNALLLHYIYKR